MIDFPLVVIGASSGGVSALMKLCAQLPSDFPAAILVVQHMSPAYPSMLPRILSSAGSLHAIHPRDGQSLHPGLIYVAPPDHHLLVKDTTVALTRGPKENRSRPAINPLFRSAALIAGARTIGVVLTGNLDDGTSGLYAIKQAGGLTVVQDPDDAEYSSMPQSALGAVNVDHRVPLGEMGALLTKLVQEMLTSPGQPSMTAGEQRRLEIEVGIASEAHPLSYGVTSLGPPSLLTCPDCGGTLMQLKEGTVTRFRCHTGHAYTANSLLSHVSGSIEEKAYTVLRTLEEAVMLLELLSEQRQNQGDAHGAEMLRARAREVEASTQGIRTLAQESRALNTEQVEHSPSE
ncbi:chemotaxis protein CheB [Deinococcus oregonensis]|uniref:protein-glutamate methylesterase n=1 Tax=Deinococcus oregonensis TaxID=1805970 RepID=A0ABV6ASL9_9DEIO